MEKVAIIGLGYVGLPLACLCAKRGFTVTGLEKKEVIVEAVNNGQSHINDEKLQKSLTQAKNSLEATVNPEKIKDCSIFIICVPTPVNNKKEPDFGPLEGAAEAIGKFVKKKDLVIVESTVFPGTCEEYVIPILNKESKLVAGNNYYFAHCPERVNPGDAFWTVENIPRVVGGINEESTVKAAEFYQKLLGGQIFNIDEIKHLLRPKVIHEGDSYKINTMPLGSITKMNSLRDAEAVKVMENTVRDVNIAFVNELAKISNVLNLDVIDIIEGMATKPFGKGPFYPGIGVGGHCIAVDPEWLKSASIKAGYFPKIIQIARDTNNSMPHYAISLLEKALGNKPIKDLKIAVLGVTYKGNIDDPRESPFYEVKKILEAKGANFKVYDPWYLKENTVNSIETAINGVDAVILVTDHNEFKQKLTPELLNKFKIKFVIDGRNCLNLKDKIKYKGIGR